MYYYLIMLYGSHRIVIGKTMDLDKAVNHPLMKYTSPKSWELIVLRARPVDLEYPVYVRQEGGYVLIAHDYASLPVVPDL